MLKFASFEVMSAVLVPSNAGPARLSRIRREAHRHHFDYNPRPGYLYVRCRAISSRTNDNYDEFPAEEIKKGYKTFIGKPVFVNHVNDNHRDARGVILDAALHEDTLSDGAPDTWVELLQEVDAVNFPKLAKAILSKRIDRTSMGCDVEHSICSMCGNRATTPAEYCNHIPRLKGKKVLRRNSATGMQEEHLIREACFGLSFFENSLLVEQPADPTAFFTGVDDHSMTKAAARERTPGTNPIHLPREVTPERRDEWLAGGHPGFDEHGYSKYNSGRWKYSPSECVKAGAHMSLEGGPGYCNGVGTCARCGDSAQPKIVDSYQRLLMHKMMEGNEGSFDNAEWALDRQETGPTKYSSLDDTDPLDTSQCVSRKDNPTYCLWHKSEHLEPNGEPRGDIDGHGQPVEFKEPPRCDLCDGFHDSLHHYDSEMTNDHHEGSLTQALAATDDEEWEQEKQQPCHLCHGAPGDHPQQHTLGEHFDLNKAQGLDAWGRPVKKPYDGHGAFDCNNYDCAEHPKSMYEPGSGMPGWMAHDLQPKEEKDLGREIGKHFHDQGMTDDARYLLDQQDQGPTKYSSKPGEQFEWDTDKECLNCGEPIHLFWMDSDGNDEWHDDRTGSRRCDDMDSVHKNHSPYCKECGSEDHRTGDHFEQTSPQTTLHPFTPDMSQLRNTSLIQAFASDNTHRLNFNGGEIPVGFRDLQSYRQHLSQDHGYSEDMLKRLMDEHWRSARSGDVEVPSGKDHMHGVIDFLEAPYKAEHDHLHAGDPNKYEADGHKHPHLLRAAEPRISPSTHASPADPIRGGGVDPLNPNISPYKDFRGTIPDMPNLMRHHDPKDPETWTNLSACKQTYPIDDADRHEYSQAAHRASDALNNGRLTREQHEALGHNCPDCGAYKYLHAQPYTFDPERLKYTAPLTPLKQSVNSLTQAFGALERDDPDAVHLESHPGHPDSPTLCNRRGPQYRTHPDPVHATCGECLREHEGAEECDDPYCQETGFEDGWHTKAEHIDPEWKDPNSDGSRDAQKSIEDALGDHPLSFLLEQNEREDGTNGPSKYSMIRAFAVSSEPTDPQNHVYLGDGSSCAECHWDRGQHPHLHEGQWARCSTCQRDMSHHMHDPGRYQFLDEQAHRPPHDPDAVKNLFEQYGKPYLVGEEAEMAHRLKGLGGDDAEYLLDQGDTGPTKWSSLTAAHESWDDMPEDQRWTRDVEDDGSPGSYTRAHPGKWHPKNDCPHNNEVLRDDGRIACEDCGAVALDRADQLTQEWGEGLDDPGHTSSLFQHMGSGFGTGDADEWHTCDQGHRHWGSAGAAGLLMRHTDDHGTHRYLLQHRAPWVDDGDTWGIPAGALHPGEHPRAGAVREAMEEMGNLPHDMTHLGTHTDDHGGWAFHTVMMQSPSRWGSSGGDDASHEVGDGGTDWFTAEQMKDLKLHSGFKKTWDSTLRAQMEPQRKQASNDDRYYATHNDAKVPVVIDWDNPGKPEEMIGQNIWAARRRADHLNGKHEKKSRRCETCRGDYDIDKQAGYYDDHDDDRIKTNEICEQCGKPRDHIHISPEAQDEMRAAAEAGQMHADMADHAEKRVVDLTDPVDLRSHMMTAHGYDESDFWRTSHDEDHPALDHQGYDDEDRPLHPHEVRRLHDWEHGHGIENDHPDYDGGMPGTFMGDSHFHTASLRAQAAPQAYVCKGCGARSPAGIGYAANDQTEFPEADPNCPGPHDHPWGDAYHTGDDGFSPDYSQQDPFGPVMHYRPRHEAAAGDTTDKGLTRYDVKASEIQPGDYLDITGKTRVHNTMTRGTKTTLAWRLKGSKAPGVRQHTHDEVVPVWRREKPTTAKESARKWYHGTSADLSPGDAVTSAAERGQESRWPTPGSESAVHVTSDLDNAWHYAHAAAGSRRAPRVYVVKPSGLRKDPWADAPEVERRADGAIVNSGIRHGSEACHWCDEFGTHPDEWRSGDAKTSAREQVSGNEVFHAELRGPDGEVRGGGPICQEHIQWMRDKIDTHGGGWSLHFPSWRPVPGATCRHSDHSDPPSPQPNLTLVRESSRRTAAKLPGGFLEEESDPQDYWAKPTGKAPYSPFKAHHGLEEHEEGHGPWNVVRHPETRAYHVIDSEGRSAHAVGPSTGLPSYEMQDHSAWKSAMHIATQANQDHGHIPKWVDRDGNESPDTGIPRWGGNGERLPGCERARRKGEPVEDAFGVDSQHVAFHYPKPNIEHTTEDPKVAGYKQHAADHPAPEVYPAKTVQQSSSREHGTTYRQVRHGDPAYDQKGAFHDPSPDDEWHGPYRVIKHPETGKFHVADNQDRITDYGGRDGIDEQHQAEFMRDYADGRQASKEKAKGIAESLWEGIHQAFDPGSTPESRRTDRYAESLDQLATRYHGGDRHPEHPGKFDWDDEEEDGDKEGRPYYEVKHPSGFTLRDYGGGNAHVYHQATPEESHDLIRVTDSTGWDSPEKPEDYGHDALTKELHNWVSGPPHDPDYPDDTDPDTGRGYSPAKGVAAHDPRIERWQHRNGYRG